MTEYDMRKELAGRQGTIDALHSMLDMYKRYSARHNQRIHVLELTVASQKQMVESRDRMIHHNVQQNNASMATLSDMNDAMIEMYGLVQDWYVASPNAVIMSTTNAAILKLHKLFCVASANKLFGDDLTIKIDNMRDDTPDLDEVSGRPPAELERLDLLGNILKIVNMTIHQKMRSPYRKNDAFDGDRMREVCDVVTDFRRRHDIVG